MNNFDYFGEVDGPLSLSKPTKSRGSCEGDGQGTHGEANTSIQYANACNMGDAMHISKGGSDTGANSLASSPCLTDALRAETTTQTSSIISATPALQNSINTSTTFWEGREKSDFFQSEDDVGDFKMGALFAASSLTKLDDKASDDCLALTLLRAEAPSQLSSGDATDQFPLMHVPPYTDDAGIWGLQPRDTDAMENITEDGVEMQNTTPIFSLRLSDSTEDVMEGNTEIVRNPNLGINADNEWGEEETIAVLDPQRSKLHAPLSAITPTKALGDRLRYPSLCLLFQSGRCRQGANCYQMHVDTGVVERLREIVENLPSCCAFHGDCNVKLWDADAHANRSIVVGGILVSLRRVAYTSGLVRFIINDAQRPLSPGALCRLHGKPGGCRYGADCWYVHLCREILEKLASTLNLNSVIPLSKSETEGLPQESPNAVSTMVGPHKVLPGQQRRHQLCNSPGGNPISLTTNPHQRGGGHMKTMGTGHSDNAIASNSNSLQVFSPSMKHELVHHVPPTSVCTGGVLNQSGSVHARMPLSPAMQVLMSPQRSAGCDHSISINAGNTTPSSTFTPLQTTNAPTAPYYVIKQTQASNILPIGVDSLSGACLPTVWVSQKVPQGVPRCHSVQNWKVGLPTAFLTPPVGGGVFPVNSTTKPPLVTNQHPVQPGTNFFTNVGLVTERGGNERNASVLACELTKGGSPSHNPLAFLIHGQSQAPLQGPWI